MSKRPSSASTRSRMICLPIPGGVPSASKPGPSSRTETTNQPSSRARRTYTARSRHGGSRSGRLEAAEVDAGLRVRVEPAVTEPPDVSIVAIAPTLRMWASSAGAMPLSASSGGKIPRARSRRPSRVVFASPPEPVEQLFGGGRIAFDRVALRALPDVDQPALRAFAGCPAPGRGAGRPAPSPGVAGDLERADCSASSSSRSASSSVRRTLCRARPACRPRSSRRWCSPGVSGFARRLDHGDLADRLPLVANGIVPAVRPPVRAGRATRRPGRRPGGTRARVLHRADPERGGLRHLGQDAVDGQGPGDPLGETGHHLVGRRASPEDQPVREAPHPFTDRLERGDDAVRPRDSARGARGPRAADANHDRDVDRGDEHREEPRRRALVGRRSRCRTGGTSGSRCRPPSGSAGSGVRRPPAGRSGSGRSRSRTAAATAAAAANHSAAHAPPRFDRRYRSTIATAQAANTNAVRQAVIAVSRDVGDTPGESSWKGCTMGREVRATPGTPRAGASGRERGVRGS